MPVVQGQVERGKKGFDPRQRMQQPARCDCAWAEGVDQLPQSASTGMLPVYSKQLLLVFNLALTFACIQASWRLSSQPVTLARGSCFRGGRQSAAANQTGLVTQVPGEDLRETGRRALTDSCQQRRQSNYQQLSGCLTLQAPVALAHLACHCSGKRLQSATMLHGAAAPCVSALCQFRLWWHSRLLLS